jgi:flagellin-like hook-associated protein FlgL
VLEQGRAAGAAQAQAIRQVGALLQAYQRNSEWLLRAVAQAAGALDKLSGQVQGIEQKLVEAQRSVYTP